MLLPLESKLTRKMLLRSKMFHNHKQLNQLTLSLYGQKITKHFSPTAALILQKSRFIDDKGGAALLSNTIESTTFSKIRAGLTQPFISTNDISSMKNKGLPFRQKMHFSNAFFGLKKQAFTLVEIMVVLAILLVLATLIIPNILRSHISSNEITTISNLTSLGKAIQEYYLHNSYRYPANLTDLALPNSNPPYVLQELASGSYTGYSYTYASSEDVGFNIKADPITPGKTGVRHFYLDETGVIRANSEREANENDFPIQ